MGRTLLLAGAVRGCFAALACGVACALLSEPAPAQQDDKPAVFLSADRQQGTNPLLELMFRPNADDEAFLWVKNPAPDAKDFLLVVKQGDIELSRKEFSVPAKKQVRQPLDKLKNAPPEPKKDEPKKPDDKKVEEKKPEPPAKIDLPELKFDKPDAARLVFQLFEKRFEKDSTGKLTLALSKEPVAVRTVPFRIMQPREYLQATAAYDADLRLTTITVKGLPNFDGAPCPVSLHFRPDLLPGLDVKSVDNGVFRQAVEQPGKDVRLVAKNIRFDDNPAITKAGIIAVSADGVDRAFLFKADYDISTGSRSFNDVREPAIRIRGAQPDGSGKILLLTQPVDKYRVPVEVDNAPEGARIEIAIDRDKNGEFDEDETTRLPSARDQHVYFNPYGPEGGLAFKTTVRDWAPEIDTRDVLADHAFRARLLTKDDRELAPPVQVLGTIMFDNTPPEGIKFGSFPKVLAKGQKMPIRVTAVDKESGIAKVNFYLAELRDGKLADGLPPIPAASPKNNDGWWTAEVPVPEKKGDITIVAQVINGVGLAALADNKVEITDPPPPVGKIKVKVVENGRPQPNLPVTVLGPPPPNMPNVKGLVVKDKAMTDDKGEVTFDGLPPGVYQVVAEKKETKKRKQEEATVLPDKTAKVNVELAPVP